MTSLLFSPLTLGKNRVAPNRIWLPAMVTWRGTEAGEVTPSVEAIYQHYARGGAGVLILEAMAVRDQASGPLLRLSHDRFLEGQKRLVAGIRAHTSALVMPQIIDFLKISRRKTTRTFMEDKVARGLLSPGVLALTDADFEARLTDYLPNPRLQQEFAYGWRQTIGDLGLQEIQQLPEHFAGAAKRAYQAGYDGVELHFAHAYTMASFLSVTNPRTDLYGGTLENRLRLAIEVIGAVRAQVPGDFLVGCRMLGSEDILGPDGQILGSTQQDAIQIASVLGSLLDFLSISRGGKFDDARQPAPGETAYPYTGHSGHACIPRKKGDKPGGNVFLAAGIRQTLRAAGCKTPVITAGKIAHQRQAEQILEDGDADFIGMARALLADPDLPRKWQAGQEAAQRVCVFCPFCEEEDHHHREVTCTLWPKVPGQGPRARSLPEIWQG